MTSPGVRPSRPLPVLTMSLTPGLPMRPPASDGGLLERLAQALDREQIPYCQWKGHWSAHRWSRGYGDVDLLVDHAAGPRFRAVAEQLGFRAALPGGVRQIPGVEHYFGHDPLVSRLLHVHVHYRLMLGEYWKRVYRIPLESQILANAAPGRPFRIPSPTHAFLIFVLRMMLRQVGRPLLSADARWLSGIQVPLASLEAASDRAELGRLLDQHFPALDLTFFDRCVRSLEGQSDRLDRVLLPWRLHRKLRAQVRSPSVGAMVTALIEKFLPPPIARRLADPRVRVTGGGLLVALIGGDGSGKSTCARELHGWLTPDFPAMRAHLGNPPKSVATLVVGAALKLQNAAQRRLGRSLRPGATLELVRHVCTARDRYRLYQRAHRFAVGGGIAVCERYPIRPDYVHVAPVIPELLGGDAGWLARSLRHLERSYYERMMGPDALFVLRLDPEQAVIRKPDEPADYVRGRARTIWETDWTRSRAQVVDASLPLTEVLKQLKTAIWSML